MRKSAKVERYLRQLETELVDLPAEARAGILRDVRAQIKKGMAKDQSATAVLRDLGAPKLIAMSHVKRRCGGEPTSPWIRWTAIATVGFFALILAGGLGWILNNTQRVQPRGAPDVAGRREVVEGFFAFGPNHVDRLRVHFNVGKLDLKSGPPGELRWTCGGAPRVTLVDGVLNFAPDQDVARCELAVPDALATRVEGTNGHLAVRQPRFPVEIDLANGRVSFAPDPARSYDYQVHVKNGLQDFFKPSSHARAIPVHIAVTNGTVKKE